MDEDTLNNLEARLFKGKKHLKRSQGIVQVPKDVEDLYFKYIGISKLETPVLFLGYVVSMLLVMKYNF